jgi:hypothetical protein
VTAAVALGFFSLSASLASNRFVLEAFFFVKSLFAFGKHEIRATVFAFQSLVCHE